RQDGSDRAKIGGQERKLSGSRRRTRRRRDHPGLTASASDFHPLAKRAHSALGLVPGAFASWCNGSTRDSGSLCLGSSPSEAAFFVFLTRCVTRCRLMPKLFWIKDF